MKRNTYRAFKEAILPKLVFFSDPISFHDRNLTQRDIAYCFVKKWILSVIY